MSKVDALRAMREAKYARNGAAPAADGGSPARTPARRTAASTAPALRRTAVRDAAPEGAAAEGGAAEQACGHRNMGGKSCSRPLGHAEKNHRYATA